MAVDVAHNMPIVHNMLLIQFGQVAEAVHNLQVV